MSDKETAPRVDNRPCDDCGNENPVWFADNEVWNAAVPERVGYICPNCFIKRADPVVTNTGWKLVPEISPSPTSIASGMVWYQDNVLKQTHKFEGTSGQASPTPEKCPTCHSPERNMTVDPLVHDVRTFVPMGPYIRCSDPWHNGEVERG